jgi:hypothetical protein
VQFQSQVTRQLQTQHDNLLKSTEMTPLRNVRLVVATDDRSQQRRADFDTILGSLHAI